MNPRNDHSSVRADVPLADKATAGMRFAAAVRYGLAILSVGVALGIGLLLQNFNFRVPAATLLLIAVAVAAWYAGRGPAVLAVILAISSCYWFFVEPVRTIYINYSEIPYFIIFVGFAVLLCWFGTVRRRIDADLRQSRDGLYRLNRELRAINNCNQALLRATDAQSLVKEICRIACDEAGYCMAWVGYAEHNEAKSVRPVAWAGAEEGYLANLGITWADTERGRSPTGTAIRSGKTCCIQDFAADPRLAPWRESALQHGFLSGIALPLKDEHASAFGSLSIYSAQPNAFTSEEIRLLEELAGDLAFGIVTLRSAAERKRAEAELRASEERFHTLVHFSFDVYWESDAEHRFTRQEFAERLADAPAPGSEIGRRRWEIPYLEPDEAAWQRHRATMDAHLPFRDFELARPTPDGGKRYVSVSGLPVFDETGRFLGYRGVGRHITERKRAEQVLRQSQAYLAEAQRLSHTGSWAFDVASDKYVYASEECLRIFELDARQDLPTREAVSRLVDPEDWDRVNADFEKSLREKVDTSSEFGITVPSGRVKYIQAIRHPVLNDAGDVVQLVGTVMDMTERKRAEEERDRLRQLEAELAHINRVSLLGELAASIAHEVGQPLSGVLSNGGACLRWLGREVPNVEEAREAARRIVRDGKRAGDIIARIRAMTKKGATPNEKLALNDTIQDVLALVGDEAKRKSVILRPEFADDLAPVAGDRVQLQQVVLNLVMNGIEAMSGVGERARDLVITTRNVEPDQVQVTVEDAGIGLDPTTIDKIFDPFYSTKPHGMGMGLSICRSILQSHGGRLWATAKDGPGTMFHFTLPKYREEEESDE